MSVQEAKRVISEYAASAKFEPNTGLDSQGMKGVGLSWPKLPPKVARALAVMKHVNDPDVNAALAAIVVRCAVASNSTGGEIIQVYKGRGHPLVLPLVSALQPNIKYGCEGTFSASTLADWICQNRDKLGKSEVLDREIVQYKADREAYEKRMKALGVP